jgi:hypothetical protein
MATKVPLNFMWADESVLLEDIQQGISSDMVKWATAFYSYVDTKFELDIYPSYPLTMSRASKYVLVKGGGVTPDLRTRAEILEAETKDLARLDQQVEQREREMEELDKREALLTSLLDTIQRERDDLNQRRESSTDPQEIAQVKIELARVRQEKASAAASREKVKRSRGSAWEILDRLYDDRHALWARMDDRGERISGDRMFRVQMALRYALDGIGSESRINVIFCKAKVSPGKYQVTGETRIELFDRIEVLPGQFLLWPYKYIIIDLSPRHRSTLAHEVVHLWGHNHPAARKVYSGIKKLPLLNIGMPTFEEKPGGFFDGSEKDIMNYTRRDPEAKDTTMNIYDQVQLRYYLEGLAKK